MSRDRLIELLGDFPVWHSTLKDAWMPEAVDRLADHLLANGVVVPPCQRGDKIYCFRKDKYGTPFVKELEVRSVTVYGIDRFTVYTTKDDVWGQTAFATFEEAEKALAERSKG